MWETLRCGAHGLDYITRDGLVRSHFAHNTFIVMNHLLSGLGTENLITENINKLAQPTLPHQSILGRTNFLQLSWFRIEIDNGKTSRQCTVIHNNKTGNISLLLVRQKILLADLQHSLVGDHDDVTVGVLVHFPQMTGDICLNEMFDQRLK